MNIGEVLEQKHTHTHTHTESVSHCSSGVPAWKEKRDVAKSSENLQPYGPCVICGICETFRCSPGNTVFISFTAKWAITHSLCSVLSNVISFSELSQFIRCDSTVSPVCDRLNYNNNSNSSSLFSPRCSSANHAG